MQSDSNKTPASSRQLQPKHVTLASTPLIGQPLIPRLPAPTSVSTVQNIGQVFRQQGQQGMYVQGLFQTGQIGAQAQRAPSMAFGVYQHPATLYSGSVAQQRQLSPRIPSYQGTSQPGFQQALPGMISGVGLALPGQAISGTNMMPSGLKPAAEASKTMKTPTMIQPKIPVPLNLPRLQPVHGFSASNSLSTGTPISPLIPSSSSLASVAITQLPTPQFYPTTGCMIRSPVSPQFLTPQPPSTQLSPVIPLSPAMFQMPRNIQPNQSFVPAASLAPMQPTLFSYSGQPCGPTTSPMSLSPQTPTGVLSASPIGISPQGNVLYSPTTPGMSPVIMMQPLATEDPSDQPTDLSLKSSKVESYNRENEKEVHTSPVSNLSSPREKETDAPKKKEAIASQGDNPISPKESFRESILNLKQRSPRSLAQTHPDEKEDPLGEDSLTVSQSRENVSEPQSEDEMKEKQQRDDKKVQEEKSDDVEDVKNDSDGEPADNNSDSEFVWEEYLQETGVQAVPPTAFKHVEYSLQSGFVKGMKLEVPNKCSPGTYWVASVVMTCGPLLRLRYDGYEDDSSADFWCDLSSSEIHSIGWCAQNGQNLQPPEAIKFKVRDWREFLMSVLTGARTAPSYLLDKTTGTTPIDQLKQGMRLELQDNLNPLEVWLVKIIENVGGRLYLRLEGVESASKDFWMFYLHYRLHPVGWTKTEGYTYKPPNCIRDKHTEAEWQEILDTALKENENMALPIDVYKDQIEIQPHRFQEGMKLEVIHPVSKNHIFPATVCKVFNNKYFLVEIDDMRDPEERSIVRLSCHGNQIGIFPITWCQSQGIKLSTPRGWIKPDFNWGEYLTYCDAKGAPDKLFNLAHDDHEFERGMKLEAANPDNQNQICASTITKIAGPLLWIHLDNSVKGMSTYIEDIESFNLFPVGWCESNGYQLKPPRMTFGKKQRKKLSNTEKKDLNGDEYRSETYHHVKSGSSEDSWCPKIFFNHKCFSGPFLSKGRIAELPKYVGPGPIELVMKEVLSMLCNVAYKSSRVLKEIQHEGPANPSMQQHMLKAKYKGKSYKAIVEVCRKVQQLEEFCRQICIKLECCPYLFSPQFVEDTCPENCMQLTKTKYIKTITLEVLWMTRCTVARGRRPRATVHRVIHSTEGLRDLTVALKDYNFGYKKKKKLPVGRPPGGHSNLERGPKIPAKRGRKKKRFHLIHKKSHTAPVQKEPEEGSLNGENGDEGFIDDDRSGDNDVDNDDENRSITPSKKRKYTHHIPAPSDIQTRGAKLPRYSFERKTHKKILLSHSSPPQRAKTKLELPAGSLPPLLTKEVYPKLPKDDDLHTDTNPLYWSIDDVITFLKTTDCSHLARIIKEQEVDRQAFLLMSPASQEHLNLKLGPAEIDGQALLLMSLPAIQEHLDLKLGPAVKLCHQVERVKLVFFEKFAK